MFANAVSITADALSAAQASDLGLCEVKGLSQVNLALNKDPTATWYFFVEKRIDDSGTLPRSKVDYLLLWTFSKALRHWSSGGRLETNVPRATRWSPRTSPGTWFWALEVP